MDPSKAWEELQRSIRSGEDRSEVAELADGLIGWIEKGGFTPSCAVLDRPYLAMGRQGLLAYLRDVRRLAVMA